MSDRYLKVVLTVIALELFWIGVRDVGVPVAAQQTDPARVVIAGIDIAPTFSGRGALPVMMRSNDVALRIQAERPLRVESDRPLKIESDRPLGVMIDRPLKIEADRPLLVENVGYTPARKPGE